MIDPVCFRPVSDEQQLLASRAGHCPRHPAADRRLGVRRRCSSTRYFETVPHIVTSMGPWLPRYVLPYLPRPRSPAYAFVPLVILQDPKWPTVIRMVPL